MKITLVRLMGIALASDATLLTRTAVRSVHERVMPGRPLDVDATVRWRFDGGDPEEPCFNVLLEVQDPREEDVAWAAEVKAEFWTADRTERTEGKGGKVKVRLIRGGPRRLDGDALRVMARGQALADEALRTAEKPAEGPPAGTAPDAPATDEAPDAGTAIAGEEVDAGEAIGTPVPKAKSKKGKVRAAAAA